MHPYSDLQVQDLLIRRGLALEVGCVMSYSAHDKLKQRLMTSLTYAPPPGYNKIGCVQVKEADAMFWEILAQRARDGIMRNVEHGFVLDTHVDAVLAVEVLDALGPASQTCRCSSPRAFSLAWA